MLGHQHFYYGTTKKIIVTVGTIFENVKIKDDAGTLYPVPLFYAGGNKHMTRRRQNSDMDESNYDLNFPAISFELTGMNFAAGRHTNPVQKIDNPTRNDNLRSYNRVPYDLDFTVYVGAKRFEDSLQIIEQTLPMFTPELNVTIKDREEFDVDSNISIVLKSVNVSVESEGAFSDRRTIEWQLGLTAKAYYYTVVENKERIKESILDMRSLDFDNKFESYIHEVNPRIANRNDPHTIVKTVIEGTFDE